MKKINKKTKLSSEVLRKKCVDLAKKIVRIRSNYTCAYCGVKKPPKSVHGSHIFSEGCYRAMSADLDNILALCNTHHLGMYRNIKEPSWHNNPVEMVEWFKEKYPQRYQELKERSRTKQQVDEMFWAKKLIELKKIYKNLIK